MTDINWHAPVGGLDALLACVPGLKPNTVAKWQEREKIARRGAGKGKATIWHASDVLEVATVFEVSRLGVLPEYASTVWSIVRGVMLTRLLRVAGEPTDQALMLAAQPDGHVVFRQCLESAPSNDPKFGSGLHRPDAPDTFLMIRTGRFVDSVAARIAAVAPHTVRRGAES